MHAAQRPHSPTTRMHADVGIHIERALIHMQVTNIYSHQRHAIMRYGAPGPSVHASVQGLLDALQEALDPQLIHHEHGAAIVLLLEGSARNLLQP